MQTVVGFRGRFTWKVHAAGYEWVDDPKGDAQRWLVPVDREAGAEVRDIIPIQDASAAATFAGMQLTLDERWYRLAEADGPPFARFRPVFEEQREALFRAYAMEAGLLGSPGFAHGTGGRVLRLHDGSRPYGEPLSFWKIHVKVASSSLLLWHGLRDGWPLKRLRPLLDGFPWPPIGRMGGENSPLVIDPKANLSQQKKEFRSRQQVIRAVPEAVAATANSILLGNASPVLIPDPRSRTGFVLDQQPHNLLAALWLELLEMIRRGDVRKCNRCGKQFVVDAIGGMRRSRKFCSESCRTLAYRGRKRRALELHAKGLKPGEIAQRLSDDTHTIKALTVRGWIQRAKAKGVPKRG